MHSSERTISLLYRGTTLFAVAACLLGAAVVGVTVRFHDWDSMVFSEWSRLIFEHPGFHYSALGAQDYQRPFYYVLQGYTWVLLGGWWGWGRLLSLAFAGVLVLAVALLALGDRSRAASRSGRDWAAWTLAVLLTLAVPDFPRWAMAGLTDIPVAALVGTTAVLAFAARRSGWWVLLTAGSAAAAMLCKPSAAAGVAGVAVACAIGSRDGLRDRMRYGAAPVSAGIAVAVVYGLAEALRLNVSLWSFWRAGIAGNFEAAARALRHDALFGGQFAGPYVRVVALFGLVYALLRCCGLRHRYAALVSVAAGGAAAILGPLLVSRLDVASVTSADVAVVTGVLLATLAVSAFAPDDLVPDVTLLARLLAMTVPPLSLWLWKAGYETRLAAAAWPGILALAAVTLAPGVRQLARSAALASLAPLAALLLAIWGGIAHLDGFDSGRWRSFRALGITGIWDVSKTDPLFVGGLVDTASQLRPVVAGSGRILTTEARLGFFYPGNVDEMEHAAPGTSSASFWAACRAPGARQLTDGSDGLAIFEVVRP